MAKPFLSLSLKERVLASQWLKCLAEVRMIPTYFVGRQLELTNKRPCLWYQYGSVIEVSAFVQGARSATPCSCLLKQNHLIDPFRDIPISSFPVQEPRQVIYATLCFVNKGYSQTYELPWGWHGPFHAPFHVTTR